MNFDSLYITLPIMLKGMAGIFIVALVIILAMITLNKATSGK